MLTGLQLVRNSLHCMEPEGSLLIHKSPPPVRILIQLDPVHNPTCYFQKIHLNINLPSTPGSPKWSLSLRFPHQNPVYASPLPHTRYMPRPSYFSRLCTRTILGDEYRSLSSSLCSFLHSRVSSSLLGPNILNTQFSNTLRLRNQETLREAKQAACYTDVRIMDLICRFKKRLRCESLA